MSDFLEIRGAKAGEPECEKILNLVQRVVDDCNKSTSGDAVAGMTALALAMVRLQVELEARLMSEEGWELPEACPICRLLDWLKVVMHANANVAIRQVENAQRRAAASH